MKNDSGFNYKKIQAHMEKQTEVKYIQQQICLYWNWWTSFFEKKIIKAE